MRVLYISPYYWPEEIGSAPYTAAVAEYLVGMGHEVIVVACRPHYPNVAPFAAWAGGARDDETHRGATILRAPVVARGGGGIVRRLANDCLFAAHIVRLALFGRLPRADRIVCSVPSALGLLSAALLKLVMGAPLIAVVHDLESGLASALGIGKGRLVRGLMQSVERLGLNAADTIVVLSDGMANEVRRLGVGRPIEVLPIWAQLPPESPAITAGPPAVMYSGNFGRKQNLDQLIPLIQRLDASLPQVVVLLQGDGSERTRLEDALAGAGIGNTRFGPLVPQEELAASLASAWVHLVPQARSVANYALPSKLINIMSVGRPFVCIAEPDTALDLMAQESGAGFCVAPGDAEGLYGAISRLIGNPELAHQMGRRGRRYVAVHMNAASVLARYEAIIVGQTGDAPEGSKP